MWSYPLVPTVFKGHTKAEEPSALRERAEPRNAATATHRLPSSAYCLPSFLPSFKGRTKAEEPSALRERLEPRNAAKATRPL